MKIKLAQNAWYGDEPIFIEIPDDWKIEYYGMPADECTALTTDELKEKFAHPIGTKTIQELAVGKKEVVIIFDDLSRATPVQPLAEIVLEELHSAGIQKKSIRFICALGCHGAMSMDSLVKKLGERIVREYAVFNHNCYENCVNVGVTTRGVNVAVNAEVMKCDLKIGIGSITPHPINGFGGGGKIIFPGVSSIDTIEQLHKASFKYAKNAGVDIVTRVGNLENKGMRLEIEEGIRMVGLDIKVDAIINARREIVDLIVGDPIEGYYIGAQRSAVLNTINGEPADNDIVIVNANPKANEASIALNIAQVAVKSSGGDIVVINHTPLGQVTHYLAGPFGYSTGGRLWDGLKDGMSHVRRIIFYTPYPDYYSAMNFGDPDKVIFATTWEEVLCVLANHRKNSQVAVVSDGTIQYYAKNK